MSDDPSFWNGDWTVGLRVWIERQGEAVLGSGRFQLLEAIERTGSISAAARQIEMSYRRAWLLIQDVNAAAGGPLVVATTGGPQGGGARLTPLGKNALDVFRNLQTHLGATAARFRPQVVLRGGSTTLHVAAAVSLEGALGQLTIEFASRQPSLRIRAIFGASDELAGHLLAGGPGDLFLAADSDPLQRLQRAGLVQRGIRGPLAENGLAAIAPTNLSLPIREPADLLGMEVTRIALGAPDCPLGRYTRAYLKGLGLYDKLAGRAVWLENSRAVGTAVRFHQAEVGLVYRSDAMQGEGHRLLFQARRLPEPIRYLAAVVSTTTNQDGAEQFLAFLESPQAARCFRRCGLFPVKRK